MVSFERSGENLWTEEFGFREEVGVKMGKINKIKKIRKKGLKTNEK